MAVVGRLAELARCWLHAETCSPLTHPCAASCSAALPSHLNPAGQAVEERRGVQSSSSVQGRMPPSGNWCGAAVPQLCSVLALPLHTCESFLPMHALLLGNGTQHSRAHSAG